MYDMRFLELCALAYSSFSACKTFPYKQSPVKILWHMEGQQKRCLPHQVSPDYSRLTPVFPSLYSSHFFLVILLLVIAFCLVLIIYLHM